MELTTKRSNFWYILPIVLGLLGGVIAYFILRKSDSKKAKICLILGIGISVIWTGAIASSGTSESDSKVTTTTPTPTPTPPTSPEFDPIRVQDALKNIPGMQELPREVLKQCKAVKSLSDYQTLVIAVGLMDEDLTITLKLIDVALSIYELEGLDKHPKVGPLIRETRSLAGESGDCLIDLVNRYER